MKVLQSFSSKAFTGGRSPLVLEISVRLSEHKESHLGAAWPGRSPSTFLAKIASPLSRTRARISSIRTVTGNYTEGRQVWVLGVVLCMSEACSRLKK